MTAQTSRSDRRDSDGRPTSAVSLLVETGKAWYRDKTFELGAALAYYAVFAISPIVLMAISVAGLVLGRSAAEGRIKTQLESAFGPTVAQAIEGTLAYSHRTGSGSWSSLVALIVLVFAATGFFGQLQSALNRIWGVQSKPGRGRWATVRDRFLTFLAVLAASAIILAGLVASAAVSIAVSVLPAADLPGHLPLWQALSYLGFFLILTLAFALLFQFLPDVEIGWREVWVGAAATALLFILGNYFISIYLRLSGTTSAYGAAGSLMVILLWVYYSSQILLLGAEFTQVFARRSGRPLRPTDNAEWAPSTPQGN